jgi:hypothetical protein
MPTLIACLSTGKGTWTEVTRIIKAQEWDKVFLITNKFGQENFKPAQNTKFILINAFQEVDQIAEQIKQNLKDQIKDFEIALNLISGTGKEHTAILKAVMELGLNFRLTTIKNNQLEIL